MFEYIRPTEAGVNIREAHRIKNSKKAFEDVTGKMSIENYQKKINVCFNH